MVFIGVTVCTNSNQVVCAIRTAMGTIYNVMGVQDFVFLFTHLACVLIPGQYKVAYIVIAICLALLVIHTLYIRVYHFLYIKFANFYGQIRIW